MILRGGGGGDGGGAAWLSGRRRWRTAAAAATAEASRGAARKGVTSGTPRSAHPNDSQQIQRCCTTTTATAAWCIPHASIWHALLELDLRGMEVEGDGLVDVPSIDVHPMW